MFRGRWQHAHCSKYHQSYLLIVTFSRLAILKFSAKLKTSNRRISPQNLKFPHIKSTLRIDFSTSDACMLVTVMRYGLCYWWFGWRWRLGWYWRWRWRCQSLLSWQRTHTSVRYSGKLARRCLLRHREEKCRAIYIVTTGKNSAIPSNACNAAHCCEAAFYARKGPPMINSLTQWMKRRSKFMVLHSGWVIIEWFFSLLHYSFSPNCLSDKTGYFIEPKYITSAIAWNQISYCLVLQRKTSLVTCLKTNWNKRTVFSLSEIAWAETIRWVSQH